MRRLPGHTGILATLLLIAAILVSCSPAVTPTAPPTAPPSATSVPKSVTQTPVQTKAAATPAPTAKATTAAPYYQGKTIEIAVEAAAGGGTDTLARIYAPFFTKYIPGNPKVIIRNQPGAAVANNIFYAKAKPDGFSLLHSSATAISRQQRKVDIVQYDVTKYRFVATLSGGTGVIIVRAGQKARLTDPKAEPLVIGTKSGEDTWEGPLIWGKEFLGWNLRWLVGFGGSAEYELALRRGEVDVFGTGQGFLIERMLQEKTGEPIVAVGTLKDGKFVRRSDMPNVPSFEELLGNKKPTGLPWQAYLSWVGPELVDKFLAAPPKTPDSIMGIITDAYVKMTKDPQFDAQIKKMIADTYDFTVGKQADELVNLILAAPPEAVDYTLDLERKFGIIAK